MEELEFAQGIVQILQKHTRENILRNLQANKIDIQGFRDITKVPPAMLAAQLKTTMKNGDKGCKVFLDAVKGFESDEDEAVIITKQWYTDEKDSAEERLIQLLNETTTKTKKSAKNANISTTMESNDKEKNKDKKVNDELIKLREKNKGLQIKIHNFQKDLEDEQRKTKGLERKLREAEKYRIECATKDEEIKRLLEQKLMLESKISGLNIQVQGYEELFQKAPKTLCFTKVELSQDEISLNNLVVKSDIDNLNDIEWENYNSVWISENDFSFAEIQNIKRNSPQKVRTARNIKTLIGRVRG